MDRCFLDLTELNRKLSDEIKNAKQVPDFQGATSQPWIKERSKKTRADKIYENIYLGRASFLKEIERKTTPIEIGYVISLFEESPDLILPENVKRVRVRSSSIKSTQI